MGAESHMPPSDTRNEKPDLWCPEGDLNPHAAFAAADFKSAVSADFTIRASLSMLPQTYLGAYNARYISRLRIIA